MGDLDFQIAEVFDEFLDHVDAAKTWTRVRGERAVHRLASHRRHGWVARLWMRLTAAV